MYMMNSPTLRIRNNIAEMQRERSMHRGKRMRGNEDESQALGGDKPVQYNQAE